MSDWLIICGAVVVSAWLIVYILRYFIEDL